MKDGFDVITGGAGFIGSHLCRHVLRRGRRVRVIDNLSTGRVENLEDLISQYEEAFEFHQVDICDQQEVTALLEGAEVVYHQAAVPSVPRSIENPLESHSANLSGTLSVFLAARDSGVRRVVYASSSSVYGDQEDLPKVESMPVDPISPYAAAKAGCELYGQVFHRQYELSNLGLRYFNVFGPRQDPTSQYAAVIPKFINRILDGKAPIIYGDGEQTRDFTYIENVAEANLQAAESSISGLSFNIAGGEQTSVNQLVEVINEILGTDVAPVYQEPRPGDILHSLASVEAAEEKIGFSPEVTLREGLRRTIEWFQKQRLAET